jgi:diguanylate cyclase (GGDEF)-like protein
MEAKDKIQSFYNKVISLLTEDEMNRNYLITHIKELAEKPGTDDFFSNLLELFVHLTFSEKEAKIHWEKIFENYKYFNETLNRNVGLRVAMFDYFINLNKMLKNPILVEIHLFKEAERLAMVDSLTGLFNRRYFDIALKKEIKRAKRLNKVLSIFLLDLDNFKDINDTRGHLTGDVLLKELADFLKESSREEDIICRYGGEEFVVILPEINGDEALLYAERLRQDFKQKRAELYKKYYLTFSGGVAAFPYDGRTAVELIANADKALYMAKFSGKDCIIKSNLKNRRHTRFNSSWKFLYQTVDQTFMHANIKEFFTKDVSLGGIRFETEDEFPLGTKLILNIALPGSDELIIVGKIVWQKSIEHVEPKAFLYGLQFFDINAEQLKKMKHVLGIRDA